jgi:hypothetical protein
MNNQTQEALKMAIEALDEIMMHAGILYPREFGTSFLKTYDACKEALEQPAQEPVAWMYERDNGAAILEFHGDLGLKGLKAIPLYTHPAQPLSDDEIERLADAITIKWHIYDFDMVKFARAIEQAHHIGVKDENNR